MGVTCMHCDDFEHTQTVLRECLLAVRTAQTFLAILSPGFSESDYCLAELREALHEGKKVFVVIEVEGATVPSELKGMFLHNLSTVPLYKENIGKLAKSIKDACFGVAPPLSPRPLLGTLAAVLAALLVASFFMWGGRSRFPTPVRPNGTQGGELLEILTPQDGSRVFFSTGDGQGGRVEVHCVSGSLAQSDTILFTMTASDGIERPQFGGGDVRPDTAGKWTSLVQVGGVNYPPKAGDWFKLRAYIVSRTQFYALKKRSEAGNNSWPPDGDSVRRPAAICTFTLIE